MVKFQLNFNLIIHQVLFYALKSMGQNSILGEKEKKDRKERKEKKEKKI
jgi:hypothetical protein